MLGRVLYGTTLVAALVLSNSGWSEAQALAQTCPSIATSYDFANATATFAADVQNWEAQSFELGSSIELAKVTLSISNVGATGDNMIVQIRTGGPAVTDPPGSTVLATSMVNDPSSSQHLVDFTFPAGTTLSANTPYYIVVTSDGANTAGYDLFVDASAPTYTPGQAFDSTNGSSWSSRADVDFAFEVWAACVKAPAPVLSTPMLVVVGMTLGLLGVLRITAQ